MSLSAGEGDAEVVHTYELRAGRRSVAVRRAPSAQVALLDYVRSLGCRDEEVTRLGATTISWRGAIYEVVPTSVERPGDG